jgi:hypothetical protein
MTINSEAELLSRVVDSNVLSASRQEDAIRILDLCRLMCRVEKMYETAMNSGLSSEQLRLQIKDQL